MKKFLAILTLIAVSLAAGCSGGNKAETDPSAAETSGSGVKHTMVAYQAEDTTEEALKYIKDKSPLYYAYLQKRMSFPLTFVSTRTVDGKKIVSALYIKNETGAAIFSDNGDGARTTVVYDKDKAYQIEESEKAVYVLDYGEDNVKSAVGDCLLKIKLGEVVAAKYSSGIENVNGVDYNYESIVFGDSTSYFYFENGSNDIRYIKTDGVLASVDEFKNSVTDDSVFNIPSDYEQRTFEDLMAKYAAENPSEE